MKKLLMILVCGFAFSQSIDNIKISDLTCEFLEIVGKQSHKSTKNPDIVISYGQENLFKLIKKQVIEDKDGNKLKFVSMPDALNFMSENGFEYVDSYSHTLRLGSKMALGEEVTMFHFIMKKKDIYSIE